MNLSRAGIGNKGLKTLAGSDMYNLKKISNYGSGTIDEGVKALASSEIFQKLEVLSLSGYEFSDRAAEALLESEMLPSLLKITADGSRLSKKIAEKIKLRFTKSYLMNI
jgi:hypothetical protein